MLPAVPRVVDNLPAARLAYAAEEPRKGPNTPQHDLTAPRGADSAPRSIFLEGRFSRMFRTLPSFEPEDADLERLAQQMVGEPAHAPGGWQPGQPQNADNPTIAAASPTSASS